MEKINIKNLALTLGILKALALFLLALISCLFSYGNLLITTLSSVFIGYNSSLLGSIIGLIYGFVSGSVLGALMALVYNILTKN